MKNKKLKLQKEKVEPFFKAQLLILNLLLAIKNQVEAGSMEEEPLENAITITATTIDKVLVEHPHLHKYLLNEQSDNNET
jgi:hypothetical protein